MKCSTCQAKAAIEIRRHNAAFCGPCFTAHLERQVQRTIESERMLDPGERVLVAVSGGKDSLCLWEMLRRQGYETTGLHLDLGIDGYSPEGRKKTEAYAELHGLPLQVIEVRQETGFTIPELAERNRRPPCSGCGLSKRYLMNRAALEGGFPVLATGHNLDDVAAILLGNVLRWQVEQLSRMTPVRPASHPRLVKTVKPLIRVTEREAVAYCLLRVLDYHEDECPNAAGATLLLYKDIVNQIEAVSAGTKQAFYQEFVKKLQPRLAAVETVTLRECEVCGQATTGEVCAYCRMMERARQVTVQRGRVTRTVLEVPLA